MTHSAWVGFFVGVLLAFDILYVVYGFLFADWISDRHRGLYFITGICVLIIVNTTGIGYITDLSR